MELVLVRHGEGLHTTNLPLSLSMENPPLTSIGKKQARELRTEVTLQPNDLLITSPSLRAIQTASILNDNESQNFYVHPFVGPRIFPEPSYKNTLPCDYLTSFRYMESFFKNLLFPKNIDGFNWDNGYINVLSPSLYLDKLIFFMNWLESSNADKVIIVSHDGTINWIRERTTKKLLSRNDFLLETSTFTVEI